MDKYEALKQYFGYSSFRTGQEEIINSILSGRDTLGVMPTGAGKSLCYQIPALMMTGITLVVSPLISLMQDQVTALVQSGIKAAYINSSLTPSQVNTVTANAANGMYKLIYVAPERLDTDSFINFAMSAEISMITVDEAHCISQWGQDFRPSYMKIPGFAAALPRRPVMTGFTATATERVRKDITERLGLVKPYVQVSGFDRSNLYFEIKQPSDKSAELVRLVSRYQKENRSGIIYCSTRKNVELVHDKLCSLGYAAGRYHAGLSEEERRSSQEDFIFDRIRIMVATNAFGMGIDKSNVSYVIHFNMPKDMESYYQEAGRAGRDGSPSDCILFYSGQDYTTARFLIEKNLSESNLPENEANEIFNRDMDKLSRMYRYCKSDTCLRHSILAYFGERSPDSCGNCSVCCSDTEVTDITTDAQKIMSCIYRVGERYGAAVITDILRGASTEKTLRFRNLSTFGIMGDSSERYIRDLCEKLTDMGYIEKAQGKYPTLSLAPSALPVLRGQKKITMRTLKTSAAKAPKKIQGCDQTLLLRLRSVRAEIAGEQRVPAYVVFSDSALREMCIRMPVTDEEFLKVPGVGNVKLERYGDRFMQEIRDHCEQNGLDNSRRAVSVPAARAPYDKQLFERLKALRDAAAKESDNEPSAVFADHVIREMCERMPADENEFLEITGVGPVKLERWGSRFINEIKAYREQNPSAAPTVTGTVRRAKTANEIRGALLHLCSNRDKVPEGGEEGITIANFADRLVTYTGANLSPSELRKYITGWLLNEGYISESTDAEGEKKQTLTEKGKTAGLIQETVTARTTGNSYIRITYPQDARRFILDNLENICRCALEKQQ